MYIMLSVLSVNVPLNPWQCVLFMKYWNWHKLEAVMIYDVDSLMISVTHPPRYGNDIYRHSTTDD